MRPALLVLLLVPLCLCNECGEEHEEWTDYISFEPSCRYPNGVIFAVVDNSKQMCRCKKPYLRHFGRCYLKADCPDLCMKEEGIVACASSTERTCENPDPAVWNEDCQINACRCKEGYLRRADNMCVVPAECGK